MRNASGYQGENERQWAGLNNVLRMSLRSLVYQDSPSTKLSYEVKFVHLKPSSTIC